MIRTTTLSSLLALLLPAVAAFAQTELERERASLRGAAHFPVIVEVEGPPRIERDREADVRRLQRAVVTRLAEAQVPVRARTARDRPNRDYLYLHVNLLETHGGTHPFSIELGMFQQVRLERDARIMLPARTWHASAVGYLSGEVVIGLQEAAISLVDDFVEDFLRANVSP